MGCTSSSEHFPEEADFLVAQKADVMKERLVEPSGLSVLHLRRGAYRSTTPWPVSGDDGAELLKVKQDRGKRHILSPEGNSICCMEFSQRRVSLVNGIDSDCSWPHHYIYSPRPLREDHTAWEQDEERSLYMWARVDKRSNVGTRRFSISFAELLGVDGENTSYFGMERILIRVLSDGRMIFKTSEGRGLCLVGLIGGESEKDTYRIAFVPCADHGLLAAAVLCVEALAAGPGPGN
mmetsp:Transcript_20366/g.63854  ORF Transcript_20366/g.63854 Transcript_20366/m.63854 type:complete len:236 (+) Transcript_20366:101-808(+)